MKKKSLTIAAIVCVLVLGIVVWYKTPVGFVNLNPDNVKEIVIFNGNNGQTLHIQDEEDIRYIIENLNSVKLKRRKISSGYKGYSFHTTIYLQNGEESHDWNNFIINSSDTVRKDPFFFDVIGGSIDYDYIEQLFEEQQ